MFCCAFSFTIFSPEKPNAPFIIEFFTYYYVIRLSTSIFCADGTTNFAHGYPSFAVSVGVLFRGKPAAAAVVQLTTSYSRGFLISLILADLHVLMFCSCFGKRNCVYRIGVLLVESRDK